MKLYIFTYSPASLSPTGCDTRSIFKQSKAGFQLGFILPRLVALPKKPSLPYYLPIAENGRDGCTLFSRELVPSEMQSRLGSELW